MAVLVLLAGCARDNPLFGIAEAGTGSSSNSSASSAGTSTSTTGSSTSAGTSSGIADGTTGPGSSESSSAGMSSSSTGSARPSCPYDVGDDVVAHFRFEEPQLWADDVGNHHGQLVSGMAESVLGPHGCGDALGVTAGMAGTVDDAPQFDLSEGSIDLWVLAPAHGDTVAVLSRDALGAASEHLTFFLSSVADTEGLVSTGHLVVRHQSIDTAAAVCSEDPLPAGAWVHVAYNFGPPGMELYIDGVLQESADEPTVPGGGIPACDGRSNDPKLVKDPPPFVGGLVTELPWFIAASAHELPKGADPAPSAFMSGGALDELRISSVRRDFATLHFGAD